MAKQRLSIKLLREYAFQFALKRLERNYSAHENANTFINFVERELKATEARKNKSMTVLEKHEQHVYDKDCYACEQESARKNKVV